MKLNTLSSLILTASFVSSCYLVQPPVRVELPSRPAMVECPTRPFVEGDVKDGNVIIPLQQALALRQWINDTEICHETNEATLRGHLEKLENRLKALSQ